MDGKEGFQHAFGMCYLNLRIVGLWPRYKSHGEVISIILFAVTFVVTIIFVTIAQTTKLVMIWGDLIGMIDNISTANLPIAVVLLKMILFRNHRRVVESLLSSVMKDWYAEKTQAELENMRNNAAIAHRMSFICIILGCGSVNGQCLIRLTQEFNILPGPPEKRLPMISSYLPYDYKTTPLYEVTWLLQYSGAALATIVYSGLYCLFCGLVLHLRGQVANLKLLLGGVEEGNGRISSREFRKKIGHIVRRHEDLLKFADGIEKVFSIMFLFEAVSCTVQICLQLFMFISFLSDIENGLPYLQILFMMIYVSHVGTHLFICCYVCDKLVDESLSIRQSVYEYQWYNLSPKDAKLLMLIMRRAEKPMVVTAGKFVTFSLQLYAQILKTSGGYLSMLLAVKDRAHD